MSSFLLQQETIPSEAPEAMNSVGREESKPLLKQSQDHSPLVHR
jgi:hypothetical protein